MPVDNRQPLQSLGLENLGRVEWNLSTARLYEEAVRRQEGILSSRGPLVLNTAPTTGRLPQDKFIVREPESEGKIGWGKINRPFEPARFEALQNRIGMYLRGKDVFVQDCYSGTDPRYRLPIRVISERASGALFARTMFFRDPQALKPADHAPAFTVLHAPGFHSDPAIDGTRSDAFILIHFGKGLILIGGTGYCGEIKKAMFTVMNYLMPQRGILPMHCSANYGKDEKDSAIFFGLSGTGKTTLSASADRTLVGDDEHGWSDDGVFNFEGGCYAKVIRLSKEGEPEIYETTRRFGTLLENVVIDPQSRQINLDDESITENTRASYPVSCIPHMTLTGKGGHPQNIIFLACDAFGVLPPISRLSTEQALYHFLAGYTAKVAGTESGVVEPQATFSPCFGGPFMPLPPEVYAALLKQKIQKHKADVWLINTGWSGGPYGEGHRIPLGLTRAMVRDVLNGSLKKAGMRKDPVFGFDVPLACPGVPEEILEPRKTWKDPAAYDKKARLLAGMFQKHFQENAPGTAPEIQSAGPKIL